jgi:hypothetical protein
MASEDGLNIDAETLRRWMLAGAVESREGDGIGDVGSARNILESWVPMDGSFHDWLERRGTEGCLT